MSANRSTAVRALSSAEIEAVSGAGSKKLFDFTVAGIHVVGTYNPDNGYHATWADNGNGPQIRSGQV